MFECHSANLSIGKYILRLLVFMAHPKTVLISAGLASAANFFIEIISFLGIVSLELIGRDTVCIAKMEAAHVRL